MVVLVSTFVHFTMALSIEGEQNILKDVLLWSLCVLMHVCGCGSEVSGDSAMHDNNM